MGNSVRNRIPDELRDIVYRYRSAFVTIGLISALLNVLVLGGSFYTLLVYDSVLPSRSIATLFGLLAMLALVYAFQFAFETMRSRNLSDLAESFDRALSLRVQRLIGDNVLRGTPATGDGLSAMRDLESIRSFLTGPGPSTLIDLPWIVFFIIVLSLFHIWLGVTALIGGALLIALAFLTNRAVSKPTRQVAAIAGYRNAQAASNLRHVETLTALGMRDRMLDRWAAINERYAAEQRTVAGAVATLGGIGRMGRMLLQAVILSVGAWLVIEDRVTGGAIFASSMLAARALAPIDQAIAQWRSLSAARLGWQRLCCLLAAAPPRTVCEVMLPTPRQRLEVRELFILAPGTQRATLQGIDFELEAGDALAIIGPSAAGKSTLARAIVGAWQPTRGSVRLDGASVDQWPTTELGAHIGYLPQEVELFDGTIADNIARFDPDWSSEAVIAAARAAGVHDMIVAMPRGYETLVGHDGANLSMGQRQRIALARALYGDPFLLMLDEANSSLDAEGDAALEAAIAGARARGAIVVTIAHRPSALSAVNKVLFLRNGRMQAFGPRDEVLRHITAPQAPASDGEARDLLARAVG